MESKKKKEKEKVKIIMHTIKSSKSKWWVNDMYYFASSSAIVHLVNAMKTVRVQRPRVFMNGSWIGRQGKPSVEGKCSAS